MPNKRTIGPVEYKVARAETKALDGNRIEAVVSTEGKDREGDIIRVAGWDLANFQKHPILLASHDYYSLRSQIGEWESMAVKGKSLVGVARYYVGEGNDEADWGYRLAQRGRAAFSVGFIPDMSKAKELGEGDDWFPHYEFNGQELLEVSHVSVPANAEALQRMKGLTLHPVVAELVEDALKDAGSASEHVADPAAIYSLTDGDMERLRALFGDLGEKALVDRMAIAVRTAFLGEPGKLKSEFTPDIIDIDELAACIWERLAPYLTPAADYERRFLRAVAVEGKR